VRIATSIFLVIAWISLSVARAENEKPLHPEVQQWLDEIDKIQNNSGCDTGVHLKSLLKDLHATNIIRAIGKYYEEGGDCVPKAPVRALQIYQRAADINVNYMFSLLAARVHGSAAAQPQIADKSDYYYWRVAIDPFMHKHKNQKLVFEELLSSDEIPLGLENALKDNPPIQKDFENGAAHLAIAKKIMNDQIEWVGKTMATEYWLINAAYECPKEAYYDLAQLYFKDPDDELSDAQGVKFLLRSAGSGNPKAMRDIGLDAELALRYGARPYTEYAAARVYMFLWAAQTHGEEVGSAIQNLENRMSGETIAAAQKEARKLGLTRR